MGEGWECDEEGGWERDGSVTREEVGEGWKCDEGEGWERDTSVSPLSF